MKDTDHITNEYLSVMDAIAEIVLILRHDPIGIRAYTDALEAIILRESGIDFS